jgi:hypothetical protein
MTIIAYDQGQVGYINYSVWRGTVNVQMIHADQRGRGVGPALVRELQRRYPDVGLDFGMVTTAGAKMLSKMPTIFIPNEQYHHKMKRLTDVNAILSQWQAIADRAYDDPTPEHRAQFDRISHDAWNDLHSEQWHLEHDLQDIKPGQRLIKLD